MRIFIVFIALGLSACVTTPEYLQDQMNNNFISIQPETPPDVLEGNWTGSMTAWLVTIKLNKNGEGVYCYSAPTKTGVQKVKYAQNKIWIQDGTKFEILKANKNQITLKAPYRGVSSHQMLRDANLSKASLQCQEKL